MSKYVDKVVFNLHETFPKPKRGKIKDVLRGVIWAHFKLILTEKVSYEHNILITSHNSYYRNTKKDCGNIDFPYLLYTVY